MSSPKLSLAPVEEQDAWDDVVRCSPQGTLFSERCYLQATGRRYQLFWVRQGIETKAGIAVMVSEDGQRCVLDDLVIYGGVLFNLDPARHLSKRRHDEFQIIEFAIEQLTQRYASIALTLSPQFEDMRPFQWYRYHEADAEKFTLDLRYTTHLDLSGLGAFEGREEESPLFERMETVRRYSIREARRKGGRVARTGQGDTLVDFYRELMARQGDAQPDEKLAGMKRVISTLTQAGRGAVYDVLNADGIIIYSVFYGWDSKRAYYLFGAGHPESRASWQGTLAHWEALKDLAQRHGVTEVDLEGVNSPKRGWFKLGFGGNLKSYYHVCKAEARNCGT